MILCALKSRERISLLIRFFTDYSRQTINSCTMKLKSIFILGNVEKILSLKGEVLKGVIIENTS